MQSGKLDQRVTLLSLTETNDRGQLKQVYSDFQTVWAHVISQRGNEAFEAARVNARQTIRVLLRFREDVDVKWKIRWDSQEYNITAIDRSQRREGMLWITCQVVGAV